MEEVSHSGGERPCRAATDYTSLGMAPTPATPPSLLRLHHLLGPAILLAQLATSDGRPADTGKLNSHAEDVRCPLRKGTYLQCERLNC